MNDATGYAVVGNNRVEAEKLDEICSVFTAEAKAILTACIGIGNQDIDTAIVTDSLSTLQAVQNMTNRNSLISWIRHLIYVNPRPKWYSG
jgi:hypothetical protein